MSEHLLKVAPEYWDALVDGRKRFEVRRNDRGFQTGDVVRLRQWRQLPVSGWMSDVVLRFEVTFVYSGDPRFGGIEPGHVVLGLAEVSP